jgi:hypothetical protein
MTNINECRDRLRNLAAQLIDADGTSTAALVQAAVALEEAMVEQEESTAYRRLQEFLRQHQVAKAQYLNRKRDFSPGAQDDQIHVLHHDKYVGAVSLRYSDLEEVVGISQRDTKAEYYGLQRQRLAKVLAANPRLTDKQKLALEMVAEGKVTYMYGVRDHRRSFNGLDQSGVSAQTITGLETRGILTTMSDHSHSGHMSIARVKS